MVPCPKHGNSSASSSSPSSVGEASGLLVRSGSIYSEQQRKAGGYSADEYAERALKACFVDRPRQASLPLRRPRGVLHNRFGSARGRSGTFPSAWSAPHPAGAIDLRTVGGPGLCGCLVDLRLVVVGGLGLCGRLGEPRPNQLRLVLTTAGSLLGFWSAPSSAEANSSSSPGDFVEYSPVCRPLLTVSGTLGGVDEQL